MSVRSSSCLLGANLGCGLSQTELNAQINGTLPAVNMANGFSRCHSYKRNMPSSQLVGQSVSQQVRQLLHLEANWLFFLELAA